MAEQSEYQKLVGTAHYWARKTAIAHLQGEMGKAYVIDAVRTYCTLLTMADMQSRIERKIPDGEDYDSRRLIIEIMKDFYVLRQIEQENNLLARQRETLSVYQQNRANLDHTIQEQLQMILAKRRFILSLERKVKNAVS